LVLQQIIEKKERARTMARMKAKGHVVAKLQQTILEKSMIKRKMTINVRLGFDRARRKTQLGEHSSST